MLQLAVEVARKTSKVETLLRIDPEKSVTSQFFIIKPELPIKGIVSLSIKLEAKDFFTRAIKCPSANDLVLE